MESVHGIGRKVIPTTQSHPLGLCRFQDQIYDFLPAAKEYEENWLTTTVFNIFNQISYSILSGSH